MKICSKCQREYPLEGFVKNKQCKDGYAGTCRNCQNEYSRNWKQRNKNRLAPIRRKLYAERYGAMQREKERIRKEQYPLRVRGQLLRAGMRDRSRKSGLGFDSTFFTVKYLMELVASKPYCECCGKRLDISFKSNGSPNNSSPSMDRVVGSNGYVRGNVALLCWRCNNLKRDATSKELRQIANWMDCWGNEVESDIQLDNKKGESKTLPE